MFWFKDREANKSTTSLSNKSTKSLFEELNTSLEINSKTLVQLIISFMLLHYQHWIKINMNNQLIIIVFE